MKGLISTSWCAWKLFSLSPHHSSVDGSNNSMLVNGIGQEVLPKVGPIKVYLHFIEGFKNYLHSWMPHQGNQVFDGSNKS